MCRGNDQEKNLVTAGFEPGCWITRKPPRPLSHHVLFSRVINLYLLYCARQNKFERSLGLHYIARPLVLYFNLNMIIVFIDNCTTQSWEAPVSTIPHVS